MRLGVQRAGQRKHGVPDLGIIERRAFGNDRGARTAIERIDDEHRVTGARETDAHFPERRTEPEDVGPDDDAGMRPFRRMGHETIGDAVRCRHFDVSRRDRLGVGHSRDGGGHAETSRHCAKLSARNGRRILEVFRPFFECFFVTHWILLRCLAAHASTR